MLRDAFGRLETSLSSLMVLSAGQQAAVEMLRGPVRYCCLVGGTRSGKTTLIFKEQIEAAERFSGSRHAMLRFRGNAARASLWLDTVPTVKRRYFPNVVLEEHRQDGFSNSKTARRSGSAALTIRIASKRSSASSLRLSF